MTFSARRDRLLKFTPQCLAALCTGALERILPICTHHWSGAYTGCFARCVEHGWHFAAGDPTAIDRAGADFEEADDLADFYNEDGIGILADVTTVAVRLIEVIRSTSPEDAALAGARAYGNAQSCAAAVNYLGRHENVDLGAEAEEVAWMESALAALAQANTPLGGAELLSLGAMPPRWWDRYQKCKHHVI